MLQMQPMILTGSFVKLLPMEEEHREILRQIANDQRIWTYLPFDASGEKFDRWFEKALNSFNVGQSLPFIVCRKSDERIIGTTRYYDIQSEHHRLMIGYTWYVHDVWGTYVNPECKYLLLQHAFEVLQVNRVEFMTDARNQRSRSAIQKLGANEEGMLRQHMVLENGVVRDTVIFSIIKSEWPDVKNKLIERLQLYLQEKQ